MRDEPQKLVDEGKHDCSEHTYITSSSVSISSSFRVPSVNLTKAKAEYFDRDGSPLCAVGLRLVRR